jgi:hypothetical protein
VWIVGIILGLVRWRRHPQVSALLVAGFLGLLVLSISQRLGFFWIVHVPRSGQSAQAMSVQLGILGIAFLLLRAVAWTAILIALFGWRQPGKHSLRSTPFQFSILGLMGLTLVVAVLCGILRWLIALLGESAVFLLQWIDDIPLYACWLTGLGVALSRWKRHPQVSQLAVVGLGLNLATSVLWQVYWTWQMWSQNFNWADVIGVASILLTGIASALVLCAALGWRREAGAAASPGSGSME